MSIADILAQVRDLVLTPEEALPLIQQHVDRNQRALFAAAALQGLLSTGIRMPTKEAQATACWEWADAMVTCAQPAEVVS